MAVGRPGRRRDRRQRYVNNINSRADNNNQPPAERVVYIEDDPPPLLRLGFICFLSIGLTLLIMRSDRQDIPLTVGSPFAMMMQLRGGGPPPDPHAEPTSLLSMFSSSSSSQQHDNGKFEKSKFHYAIPGKTGNITESTLPPPKRTNQTTVVIVLSSRNHFDRREAIRETWARDNDNVYFVIGGPDPDNNNNNQRDNDLSNPLSVSSLLLREQQLYGDMIDALHPDTYKSLPYKLHFGMRWVALNIPHVNWIVKCDDDHIVRVKLLQFFVLRKFNPQHPIVIGSIVVNAPPHKTGKWAEDPKFTKQVYPPWAFGSAGYIVSRAVADYISRADDLYYYQGEDTSLGIWLDESPLTVTWIDTPELNKDKACDNKHYIIGHDWPKDQLIACFNTIGDSVPDRQSIIAFDAGRKAMHPEKIQQW